ncbi:MAG: hypothetical protein Dbin4_03028 [Alphaproteobacteria bacterium]|nr:hypothetical protein [Alphaproteobacteria bacterium]
MAIRVKQSATFMWPVEVMIPKSGGGFDKVTFDAEFRRLTTEEWREMVDRMAQGKIDFSDIAIEIVTGWSGVNDEPDTPLPFSHTALKELLNIAQVPGAIYNAFSKSLNGPAREKN